MFIENQYRSKKSFIVANVLGITFSPTNNSNNCVFIVTITRNCFSVWLRVRFHSTTGTLILKFSETNLNLNFIGLFRSRKKYISIIRANEPRIPYGIVFKYALTVFWIIDSEHQINVDPIQSHVICSQIQNYSKCIAIATSLKLRSLGNCLTIFRRVCY